MSFPTSPTDGQIHDEYKYSTITGSWNTYTEPDAISIVKKSIATESGIKEVFRCTSALLTTSGLISLSGTRGNFVHISNWTWSSNHQGVGYGTLTRHNLGNYSTIQVYLDVAYNGSVIVSTNWGGSMTYKAVVEQFHGGTLDFTFAGTLHSVADSGYTRYSAS